MSAEGRQAFLNFWGVHVSAFNLDPAQLARVIDDRSLMSIYPDDLENSGLTLSKLLNWFQKHVCSDLYCLRMNKATKEIECWFGHPY
jgi:ATP-dependent DNA helicase PIF1